MSWFFLYPRCTKLSPNTTPALLPLKSRPIVTGSWAKDGAWNAPLAIATAVAAGADGSTVPRATGSTVARTLADPGCASGGATGWAAVPMAEEEEAEEEVVVVVVVGKAAVPWGEELFAGLRGVTILVLRSPQSCLNSSLLSVPLALASNLIGREGIRR